MAGIEIQVEVGLSNSIEHLPFKSLSSDDSIYTTSFQCGLDSVAQVKKDKTFSNCSYHGFKHLIKKKTFMLNVKMLRE
jgi:hypothetical protein